MNLTTYINRHINDIGDIVDKKYTQFEINFKNSSTLHVRQQSLTIAYRIT